MDDKPNASGAIFHPIPLKGAGARRAYPLVHLFNPQMDLTSWLGYSRSFARQSTRNAGLQALEDERGYIHAVFAYNVQPDIRHRRLLRVCDVVIGHLPGRILAETLLESVVEIARKADCNSVLFELAETGPARDALQRAGFSQTDIECFLASRSRHGTDRDN